MNSLFNVKKSSNVVLTSSASNGDWTCYVCRFRFKREDLAYTGNRTIYYEKDVKNNDLKERHIVIDKITNNIIKKRCVICNQIVKDSCPLCSPILDIPHERINQNHINTLMYNHLRHVHDRSLVFTSYPENYDQGLIGSLPASYPGPFPELTVARVYGRALCKEEKNNIQNRVFTGIFDNTQQTSLLPIKQESIEEITLNPFRKKAVQ